MSTNYLSIIGLNYTLNWYKINESPRMWTVMTSFFSKTLQLFEQCWNIWKLIEDNSVTFIENSSNIRKVSELYCAIIKNIVHAPFGTAWSIVLYLVRCTFPTSTVGGIIYVLFEYIYFLICPWHRQSCSWLNHSVLGLNDGKNMSVGTTE